MGQRPATTLPEEFLLRLSLLLPAHYPTLIESFYRQRPLVLRCNTNLTSLPEAESCLRDAGVDFSRSSVCDDSVIVAPRQRDAALASACYQQGFFYAQGLASQLAVLALDPQPQEEILDMCAAPGGKTAHISCLMHGSGRVAAVEHSRARFFKLKNTVSWQQLTNVHPYHKDAIHLWRKVPERFDRVLLDAPCSSEARFNVDNVKTFQHWSRKKVLAMAKKQRALFYSAFHCLKPGGRLTYATCAFSAEENEAVIDAMLRRFEGRLSVESLPMHMDLPNTTSGVREWQGQHYHPQVSEACRVLPNATMGGFFICNLRKSAAQ